MSTGKYLLNNLSVYTLVWSAPLVRLKNNCCLDRTNPTRADTDGDGLSDYDEIMKYKTDPLKVDTDGDGLSDYDEIMKYKTDPLKVDTDGDGFTDAQHV